MTTPTPLPPKDGIMKCPFCGEQPMIHFDGIGGMEKPDDKYNVTCRTKGCHGVIFNCGFDLFKTKAEAIAAWNTRCPTWMPIESAPKDGSVFLAWVLPDSTFGGARLERGSAQFCRWQTDYFMCVGFHSRGGLPTHWLPLPLPPKENSDE